MARSRAKRPTLPELMKQVEIELRHVRTLVKDAIRNFESKVEAQIEQAANDLLRALPEATGAAGMRRRESLIKAAQKLIADLRVKPEKGRYRDIKRIHNIADELTALASRMQ
jgi:hypothetical protein